VCQVAVVTENILSKWSNLKVHAFCLALLFVLLNTVSFVCLVTLLVAARYLTLHSKLWRANVLSELPVCKVLQRKDILWKEQPVDFTVKIVPWIIKVPSVSSNCNISAVSNLQWNKRLIYNIQYSGIKMYHSSYSCMIPGLLLQKWPESVGE
jgi:hypothetical protein